jgi:hypothetical protein
VRSVDFGLPSYTIVRAAVRVIQVLLIRPQSERSAASASRGIHTVASCAAQASAIQAGNGPRVPSGYLMTKWVRPPNCARHPTRPPGTDGGDNGLERRRAVLGQYLAGSTGLGKSWLACALGHKDYRDNRSVLYQRVSKLFAELALSRGSSVWARPVFRRTVAGHRGR